MRDFEIVAGVFIAIFALGVAVGIIVVIAISALRHRRAVSSGDRHPPQYPRWPLDGGFRS